MNMHKEAIEDCVAAIKLDSSNAKAHFLLAQCLTKLGNFRQAEISYKNALSLGFDCQSQLQTLAEIIYRFNAAEKFFQLKDYSGCIGQIHFVELHVTHSIPLKILRAKAFAGVGRNDEIVIEMTE